MRRSSAVAAVLAIGLAGCASNAGLPLGPQVARPVSTFDGASGEADFVLRTFLPAVGDEAAEVAGARCRIESLLYAFEATTPARVSVPSFGPQSPTLQITCAAAEKTGAAQVPIRTQWIRYPGAWGYPAGPGPYWDGAWGPWGPWGYAGWSGPSYVVFAYPDLGVILR